MRSVLLIVLCLATSAARGATLTAEVQQSDGSALPDTVVFALPLDGQIPEPSVTPRVLNQDDERFRPHVLPVQRGGSVRFTNEDDINHHAYSFSRTRRFDIQIRAGEAEGPIRFQETGTVPMGCNIHDWMLAYIHVVDTPWFTTTNSAGEATIRELPPGEYRVKIWHPRAREDMADHERVINMERDEHLAFQLEQGLTPPHRRDVPEFDY